MALEIYNVNTSSTALGKGLLIPLYLLGYPKGEYSLAVRLW